jgi:ankyrin repeat protein
MQQNHETPLHYAVMRDTPNAARWLLDHGAHVNAATLEGETPLHWASRHSAALVKLLLDVSSAFALVVFLRCFFFPTSIGCTCLRVASESECSGEQILFW